MSPKRKYSYIRPGFGPNKQSKTRSKSMPVQSSPPSPGHVGPWVPLSKAEPVVGQRVIVSFVQSDGKRRYRLGGWAISPFEGGVDSWMSISINRDNWTNLSQKEPEIGQRVVCSHMEGDGIGRRRDYTLGRWGTTPFPPGMDFWIGVPDAK